jgi:hypothetical protein
VGEVVAENEIKKWVTWVPAGEREIGKKKMKLEFAFLIPEFYKEKGTSGVFLVWEKWHGGAGAAR